MRCKWQEQTAIERLRSHGLMFLRFCEASAGCVLIEYASYGEKRLTKFFEEMWDKFTEDINFYAADDSGARDAAETLRVAQEREFKALGVDIRGIDAELNGYDQFNKHWRPARDRIHHANRVAYIEQMDLSVRTYHYTTLLWFRDNKDFGSKRLSELYRRLRREWCQLLAYYLECTPENDAKALEYIKILEGKLNAKGVTIDLEKLMK